MPKIFEHYNFEKDNYSIAFKKLGDNSEFEISEKEILKKIKKEWDFKEVDSIGRCGYHYLINVIKNNQVEASYLMCFNCKRLIREKTSPPKIYEIAPEFMQSFIVSIKNNERLHKE